MTEATAPEKITSATIRAALQARYPAPEYAVLFEVTDATGARHTRSADAVIMSCWPSRGLELHGAEIKVSRYDWMNERKQPKKAETIAAYCDRWWLLTGPGVVLDISEVPPAWGWMEYVPAHTDLAGKRTAARLVTRREPEKTEAKVADRNFLAALLRNAAKAGDGLIEAARKEAREEADRHVDERVAERLKHRTGRSAKIVAEVEAFEAATGISLGEPDSYTWMAAGEGRKLGEMVMAVRRAGLDEVWGGLQSFYTATTSMVAKLEEQGAALGIQVQLPKPKGRRR